MAQYNLGKLTDKQLIELENKIAGEKERRKDSLMYKGNLDLDSIENRFKNESKLFSQHTKTNDGIDFDFTSLIHSPVWKIQSNIFGICDYILGNYKTKIDSCGNIHVRCDSSRILLDNKEEYKEMYDELYSIVDKWTDKLLDRYEKR